MDHRDADLTDVMVVLSEELDLPFDEVANQLKLKGLEVCNIDPVNGVIEGTIETSKLPMITELSFCKCVRKVFEYTADFPQGDPRNLDNDEDQDLPESR